ncbi:MAG: hypothetical protein OIF32_01000 [Campylobacterales bacterium]|nr:hypothetical protein [Campylobacterales bacterium]
MSRFYFSFFIVNLVVFIALFIYGEFQLLLNVEVAAVGSIITTLGSFHGYKKMVKNKAKDYEVIDDEDEDRDLNNLEDPYGLYDDDEIKNDENLDIKKVVKEERAKLKTNWGEVFSTFKANISFFRLAGYVTIIFAFFTLLEKDLLHPIGFILGLSLVPITVLIQSKKML